jgi:phospholipid N-methyltransferase
LAKGQDVDQNAHIAFLKGYLQKPHLVGAVSASSQALASAICEPFRRHPHPARVLEVGAGTGAITRYLGTILGEQDELDICEIDPRFVDFLHATVLTRPEFCAAVDTGRLRVLCAPVQKLRHEKRYDFIVCGLPFSCFELSDVQEAFAVMQRMLKPGGVMSYYEYVGFRKASRLFSIGRRRRRIKVVSAFLKRTIRKHQFERRTVFQNVPPAHARHLRFDS